MLVNHMQQIKRIKYIIVILFFSFCNRFAYIGIGGKMEHGINLVAGKYRFNICLIGKISPDKCSPFHSFPMPINQVIEYDGFIAFLIQLFIDMGADVAGSAAD